MPYIEVIMGLSDGMSDKTYKFYEGNIFTYRAPHNTPTNHGWVGRDSNGEIISSGDNYSLGDGLVDGVDYRVDVNRDEESGVEFVRPVSEE